jgi:apolipoprotein N-acyltransferase
MIKGLFLAILSGLLLILPFPKFDLEFLAWIALVPLLLALREKSLKAAFCLSYLTGMIFLMGTFYWINVINGCGVIEFLQMGIYLSLYFGLFGLLFTAVTKRNRFYAILWGPALWISLEYLRSHAGFLALPWSLLGHSQYMNLPLIQISAFTGVYGVSFLIVMVNIALSEIIANKDRAIKPAVVTLSLVIVVFAYGFIVLSDESAQSTVPVTVIQGNIPQDIKWKRPYWNKNFDKHEALTREALAGQETSLIVWPESAVPGPFPYNQAMFKKMKVLAEAVQTNFLIGTSARPKIDKNNKSRKGKDFFNSALLLSAEGQVTGQYNKIHPLPFAEYLPWREWFPWPSRYKEITDYTQGREYTLFDLNQARFGVLICWENIFPDIVRRFVRDGAQFIVNITNEGWFGETAAPYQFLAMNVFRAVENGVTIVRAANTGISGFIDPRGRLIGKVSKDGKDIFIDGFLTRNIPLSQGKTFYTLYGDIFVFFNIIFVLSVSVIFLLARKSQSGILK